MANLSKIRIGNDIEVTIRMTANSQNVHWIEDDILKVVAFCDVQKRVVADLEFAVDAMDSTKLLAKFAAADQKYIGTYRIFIVFKNSEATATYDAPVFELVRYSEDADTGTGIVAVEVNGTVSLLPASISFDILSRAYIKPSTGIPESDMAQAVKDKLNAGAVYDVEIRSTPYDDIKDAIDAGKIPVAYTTGDKFVYAGFINDTIYFFQATPETLYFLSVDENDEWLDGDLSFDRLYTKPSTGIPENDLSQAVKTKLNSGGDTSRCVHLAGTETITGDKTFSGTANFNADADFYGTPSFNADADIIDDNGNTFSLVDTAQAAAGALRYDVDESLQLSDTEKATARQNINAERLWKEKEVNVSTTTHRLEVEISEDYNEFIADVYVVYGVSSANYLWIGQGVNPGGDNTKAIARPQISANAVAFHYVFSAKSIGEYTITSGAYGNGASLATIAMYSAHSWGGKKTGNNLIFTLGNSATPYIGAGSFVKIKYR